ncbi:MAG: aminotransferase class III-fold pyridoxal phosphate-dependent enzyme [Bacteroidetes bacterium]|nr:aminotransferase class III-fold pyridoxal phosphate-dependent enzyme [Bacteroidota bacterium]
MKSKQENQINRPDPPPETILENNLTYTLFPWSKQKGLNPLVIDRAEGVYLVDATGKRYLDFSSGLMNVNIGHGNQRVTDAVVKQMQKVSYITPGHVTNVRGKLAKKLAELAGESFGKTLFTVCGASAVENAIKLARMATGRHKIIGRYRAFHGASYGALSAAGDPRRLAMDSQQVPNMIHVEDPYCYRCPFGQQVGACRYECVSHIRRIIEFEGRESVAAILMEGESGTSGCIKYPPDYWRQLRELCDEYGILLIADEVMSGFGRTGKWFGFQHHGVVPDMITMAKGITSGYLPLGALMISNQLAALFDDKALMLGLTYAAHPVSCAAALEVLSIYEDDELINRAAETGALVEHHVAGLIARHPSIGDFRNTGLLGCLELVKDRQTKEPLVPYNAKPAEMGVMNTIASRLRELGLLTFIRWNYVFIAPPLTISPEELQLGIDRLDEALLLADEAIGKN